MSVEFNYQVFYKCKSALLSDNYYYNGIGRYQFKSSKIPSDYLERIKKKLAIDFKDPGFKSYIYVYNIFSSKHAMQGDTAILDFDYIEPDKIVDLE
jgi:hypothetical protein